MGYLVAAYLIGGGVILSYVVWVTRAATRAKIRLLSEAQRPNREAQGRDTGSTDGADNHGWPGENAASRPQEQ